MIKRYKKRQIKQNLLFDLRLFESQPNREVTMLISFLWRFKVPQILILTTIPFPNLMGDVHQDAKMFI